MRRMSARMFVSVPSVGAAASVTITINILPHKVPASLALSILGANWRALLAGGPGLSPAPGFPGPGVRETTGLLLPWRRGAGGPKQAVVPRLRGTGEDGPHLLPHQESRWPWPAVVLRGRRVTGVGDGDGVPAAAVVDDGVAGLARAAAVAGAQMLLPASRRRRQPGWFSPGGGGLVPDGLAAGGRGAGRRVAGRQGPDVGVEHLE